MSPTVPHSSPVFAVALAVLVAVPSAIGIAPTTATATANDATSTTSGNEPTGPSAPEIVAVYPNPVTDGDAGEFVVVSFPNRTHAGDWSLSDGEATVRLPNATVSGRVAVSPDPAAARNLTDHRVLGLPDDLSLANGGETVRLVAADADASASAASAVSYADAPEGERWHRVRSGSRRSGRERSGDGNGSESDEGWQWTPLGATDFEVVRSGPASARAFVLPDAPAVPLDVLRTADRRLLLAGYTFTSARVADALAAAARRGVAVRVLVDADPVGGLARREAKLLDSLVARGVEVRVLGDARPRYRFHHPKYAVVDDRALVLTENWKPSGTGGHASRGWGVAVRSGTTADRLAAVFRADADWRGATRWATFRQGETFETANASDATYPTEIRPENLTVESTSLLVAPDNAEGALVSLLDSANDSIRVQQVAVGDRRFSLLRASLRAARRGVDVRILLSSAWYAEEDNRGLVEWLNRRAEREGLPLEARLANPQGRYEKIHAKGVVVDGDAAVVGSLNWNNNSARENREVALLLRGEKVGGYYADAFDADWRASAGGPDGGGGANRLPVGLLAAVAVGSLAALLYARREVVFENE